MRRSSQDDSMGNAAEKSSGLRDVYLRPSERERERETERPRDRDRERDTLRSSSKQFSARWCSYPFILIVAVVPNRLDEAAFC